MSKSLTINKTETNKIVLWFFDGEPALANKQEEKDSRVSQRI